MRFCVVAGAVLGAALWPSAARADKLVFSPSTFQIYGSLGDGETLSRPKEKLFNGLAHREVAFAEGYAPGSIVVRTGERRLFYVLPDNRAIMYLVGVGREGFQWSGQNRVTRKAEWPDWRPPKEMIVREARRGRDIPDFMPGGPDNPLGARAIYIGDTEYRIHGTSQPWTIGQAVSSGCIRMVNEEVIDLYNRVEVGAMVVVE